jgi:hypothetical protein
MSYWSLRRAAERAAAGHELARSQDGSLAPATARVATHDAFGVELRRPSAEPHAASVTSHSLRQRAADLERALWTIPSPDPEDVDPDAPGDVRIKARSAW